MPSLQINIDATGAQSGARVYGQASQTVTEAAGRAAAAADKVAAALKRQQEAERAATQAAQAEFQLLTQKIALQLKVRDGALTVEQATRKMYEAEILAKTGSQQLAQSLASARVEFERNAVAINKMEGAARQAGTGIGTLVHSFSGLFAGVSAGVIIKMADDFALLRARVESTVGSAQAAGPAFEAIFNLAQRVGIPIETVVSAFQRLQQGAKQLGASNADILRVVETFIKLGTAGGVSTEALKLSLVQIAQGLGSANLAGDELKSVLENNQPVAELLATKLKRSTSELKEMGAAGKLTAQEVFPALLAGADEADKKFALLPKTVSRAIQEAVNEINALIDQINEKLKFTQKLAEAISNAVRRGAFLLDVETQTQQIERLRGELERFKKLEQDLQKDAATGAFGSEKGGIVDRIFGGTKEAQLQSARDNIARISEALKTLEAAAAKSKEMLDQHANVVRSKFTPEQIKAQEETRNLIERLTDHAATLNLSGAALAAYISKQALAETGSKELADQVYKAVLADEAAKDAKETHTKAIQAHAQAEREAAAEKKQIAKDLIDAELLINKLQKDKFLLDEKERKANAASLRALEEETLAIQEENQVLAASLGPKAKIRDIEKQIALARIERQRATDLLKASENTLTEAERAAIDAKANAARANVELSDTYDRLQESIRGAIDVGAAAEDAAADMALAFIESGGNIKKAFKSLKEDAVDIFRDLFRSTIREKLNWEGILGKNLLTDLPRLFQQGGQLASNAFSSSAFGGGAGGQAMASGIDFGAIFGRTAVDASQVSWNSAGDSFFNGTGQGSIFQSGQMSGTNWGNAFGIAGVAAAGVQIGKAFSEGKYGSGAGGVIGGGIGAFIGGPQGAALGAQLGMFFGSLFDGFFKHTPTKGTRIRKEVKNWLKDIEVSFAGEIDSGDYFFEETKKLAKKMFGGDFLKASKQILNDMAGPELAKQLQALGAFITADQAKKLGKSVEQTGVTFGNLILDNLGIDPAVIQDAIDEMVEKGGISFEGLINKLNTLSKEGEIGAEFFTGAIEGAVSIFYNDLPKAINVAAIAAKSFTDAKTFDLEKFNTELEKTTTLYDTIGNVAANALMEGFKNGLSAEEVAEQFGKDLEQAIQDIAIEAFIQDFINKKLFEGIDLSDGLDAGEIELLRTRVQGASKDLEALRTVFETTKDSADDLVATIKDLNQQIAALESKRIDIRVNLISDLTSIGAIPGLDAAIMKLEIANQRLDALYNVRVSPIATQPFLPFSNEDLEQALDLLDQQRQAILDVYNENVAAIQSALQAQIQAINDALQAEVTAINEKLQKTIAGIQAEFEAKREGVQNTIDALQAEAEQVRKVAQERIEGLQKELAIAQDFQQAADQIQGIITNIIESATGISRGERLSQGQREADALRGQLLRAGRADRPELFLKLADVLQRQVSSLQNPTTAAGRQNLERLLEELAQLQAAAAKEGASIGSIEEQIRDEERKMNEKLASIDVAIQGQQALMEDLSKQEQAAIKAAQEKAAREITDAQEKATQAIKAAQESADKQVSDLREAAVRELIANKEAADAVLKEQIKRLEEQKAVAIEALEKLVGVEEAARLLNDPMNAQIIKLAAISVTVDAQLAVVREMRDAIRELLGKIKPAAGGYYNPNTNASHLFLTHPNEEIAITPRANFQPTRFGASSGRSETRPIVVNVNVSSPVNVQMEHTTETMDGQRIGEIAVQAVKRTATTELRSAIQDAVRTGRPR